MTAKVLQVGLQSKFMIPLVTKMLFSVSGVLEMARSNLQRNRYVPPKANAAKLDVENGLKFARCYQTE